ncbi:MAG: hypothetical protein IPN69_13255 [Acidobacteria bacterium]|nr:hypothetical protein [Acidobacteriota bacterium]
MRNRLFIGLALAACLLMFGCQQSNNAVNNNKAANTNTATNANAVTNTNTTTNANTNSASTPTNTNTASSNSETSKKDEKSEEKADCVVKTDNADFYVSATEKDMKLKKGAPIIDTGAPMGQGIIVVKAKVGNEWIKGEIQLDDTTCNDAPEDAPKKK